MTAQPKNLAASVHQRLLNLSQQRNDDFNRLLILFAIERLLYRLSVSDHAHKFVLKGALLFMVWTVPDFRPTRDLDLLGFGDPSDETLLQLFQTICQQPVVDDGLIFDPQSVRVRAIRADQEYQGQRVELTANLGRAKLPLQIDIGFGDLVLPAPVAAEYPTLLDFPSPHLRVYSRESVIAEKFHAMATLDWSNSRMKDFYDLWILSRLFPFDGVRLTQAIDATFTRRNTAIPAETPTALTAEFAETPMKITQWQAFLRRNRLAVDGASFADMITELSRFLLPPLQALAQATPFSQYWTVEGGWR
ncbi:MAG: nucleotidyl transferase AbiEii/AbiGii toxin family protein [Caldilineaceae bacterium]